MADGNRDLIADLTFVVRHFNDLAWDDPRLAEAMEQMWHKGMERGRKMRGAGADGSKRPGPTDADGGESTNPADKEEEVPA